MSTTISEKKTDVHTQIINDRLSSTDMKLDQFEREFHKEAKQNAGLHATLADVDQKFDELRNEVWREVRHMRELKGALANHVRNEEFEWLVKQTMGPKLADQEQRIEKLQKKVEQELDVGFVELTSRMASWEGRLENFSGDREFRSPYTPESTVGKFKNTRSHKELTHAILVKWGNWCLRLMLHECAAERCGRKFELPPDESGNS